MKRALIYGTLLTILGGTAYGGQFQAQKSNAIKKIRENIAQADNQSYKKAFQDYYTTVIKPIGSQEQKAKEAQKLMNDIIEPAIENLVGDKKTAATLSTIQTLRANKELGNLLKDHLLSKIDTLSLDDDAIKELMGLSIKLGEKIEKSYEEEEITEDITTQSKAIKDLLDEKFGDGGEAATKKAAVVAFIFNYIVTPELKADDFGNQIKTEIEKTLKAAEEEKEEEEKEEEEKEEEEGEKEE